MQFSVTHVYSDDLLIYLLKDGCPIHCFTEKSFVDFIFGFARYVEHCDALGESDKICDGLIYEFKSTLSYDTDADILSLSRFDESFLFFPKEFADYYRSCKDFNALDFVMEISNGKHSHIVGGMNQGAAVGGTPPSSAENEVFV